MNTTMEIRPFALSSSAATCPDHLAADCPFRGCGKRPGGPKRTLDILGDCRADECPKEEVEDMLAMLDSVYKKTGAQGTFKLAFTIPEAKARMALALAITKLAANGTKSESL
ncbi:MAG: hypothetical protein OEV92_11910, partial [Nitrospinota bacterium]|nr:hypothetical protein [Nitrospinota bacterium]